MAFRKIFVAAVTARIVGSPLISETHHISPDRYHVTFSDAHPPIARLRSGDTVVTKCLDSCGRDETGKLILDGDNVLTGPFSVNGAEPGDTQEAHVTLVPWRLERSPK
jgi:acetamidase/formamidase